MFMIPSLINAGPQQKNVVVKLRLEKPSFLYANGFDSFAITIEYTNYLGETIETDDIININFKGPGLVCSANRYELKNVQGFKIVCFTTLNAGRTSVELNSLYFNKIWDLDILPDFSDLDKDGFFDVTELISEEDRENFVRWFTNIAKSLLVNNVVRWDTQNQDCSGFIRFCYMEALKKHDEHWLNNFDFLYEYGIPDVKRFNYPDIPLIRERLFRKNSKIIESIEDIVEGFDNFADANTLMVYNTVFISRDITQAQTGDLMFYVIDSASEPMYHSMIYLGGKDREIIYHTGRDGRDPGEIRLTTFNNLLDHPDERWYPIPENPYFYGFYRFRILE